MLNPQLLELPCSVALAIAAYAGWRGQRLARKTTRDKNGKRYEVWDEVEGKVNSITVVDDWLTVSYEFLTPQGSQEGGHRVQLKVSEPYVFGSREADLAKISEKYFIAFPAGHPARVRFNPKQPSESVLARARNYDEAVRRSFAENPAAPVPKMN